MSAIKQHESRAKYGGNDPSIEKEPNCMKSSLHTSKCPSKINRDRGCHNSPAFQRNSSMFQDTFVKTEKTKIFDISIY